MTARDDYMEAASAEPTYTLKASDLRSPQVMLMYASLVENDVRAGARPPEDMDLVREARAVAEKMRKWKI